MAEQLKGLTVAIAGGRKGEDMTKLVQNMGGTALLRPAQGTVFLDNDALREGLADWIERPPYLVILTTGIGLEALFDMAESMNLGEQFQETLSGSLIAARGYKTFAALKKRGLTPVARDDDGSSTGLIRGLAGLELQGKEVLLQLHGDSAPVLTEWLAASGAVTREILPYRHIPPEPGELDRLLEEILTGKVDAVAFTSAPQFRFLSQFAKEQGQLEELCQAFEERVLAVSVGRITSAALQEEGIQRIVMPEHERMGSMLVELGRYVSANRQ